MDRDSRRRSRQPGPARDPWRPWVVLRHLHAGHPFVGEALHRCPVGSAWSGQDLGRTGRDRTGKLTFDRLIQDGIEVAEFVHRRLQKSKVILLASSLGSLIGLAMVKRRPDLFCAYVGTDQNVGMARGREAAHHATLDRLRRAGLTKGVAALERIGSDPSRWSAKDFTTTAQWAMRSDPRTSNQIMKLLRSAIWFFPGFTLRDIKNFVSGMEFSTAQLLKEMSTYDAWQQGIHFEVPFFILQGENDVLTPPNLAAEFFTDVVAPLKDMVIIRDAGHFAAFMQPEQFLNELLIRVRPVATAPESAGEHSQPLLRNPARRHSLS